IPGGPAVARRETVRDGRRHERDSPHADRARAVQRHGGVGARTARDGFGTLPGFAAHVVRSRSKVQMTIIRTKIKSTSEEFEKNAAVNIRLARELHDIRERIARGGGERAREKRLARGKLLPRDRIRMLMDDDATFLEIGQLAAWQVYDDEVPAAGIVAGITRVSGVECMIVANDATVK